MLHWKLTNSPRTKALWKRKHYFSIYKDRVVTEHHQFPRALWSICTEPLYCFRKELIGCDNIGKTLERRDVWQISTVGLWVSRRKEPILGYIPENDEKKEFRQWRVNSSTDSLNKKCWTFTETYELKFVNLSLINIIIQFISMGDKSWDRTTVPDFTCIGS